MICRTTMHWLMIYFAALSIIECEGFLEADLVVTFAKQFMAPQPLPILYNVSKETKIKFIMAMSKEGFTLKWTDGLTNTDKFLLVIVENDEHQG